MSDQRTVSKNIAGTFLVQIPNYIFGMIAGIFLTRQLGPESKGVYTILIANIQLLVLFLGLNLSGAIQFFISNKKLESSVLFGSAIYSLLLNVLIVFAFLFLIPGMDQFLLEDNFDSFYFKIYLFISFFISNFNLLVIGFLQGNHRFKNVNTVSFINGLLNFIIFSSLFFLAKYDYLRSGLPEILFFTVIILGVNSLFLIYFLKKHVPVEVNLTFSFQKIRPLLKFMLPAYISVLINFFNYRLTIWLVNYYEGSEQLGYFSLALNFAQMMLMVTMAINTVLFPYFASKSDVKEALRDFAFAFKLNMFVMLGGSLFLILFSGILIPLFYTDVFIPAIVPVQILTIGTFFCSLTQVFGHFFGARDKNWINTFIYLIALISLVVLGVILIPQMGIEGAAWASGGSYLLMLILFMLTFKMHFKGSVLPLFLINKEDIARLKSLMGKEKKLDE